MKVIAVGNAIIDHYTDLNKKYPGGSALNVAFYTKLFGADESSFIGVIGNDEEGRHILNVLKENDINTSNVRVLDGKTGIVSIQLDSNNDRIIGEWKKGVLEDYELLLSEKDISFIQKHDILHFGHNTNVFKDIEKLTNKIKLSFDFSTDEDISWFETYGAYLYTVFLSRSKLSLSEIEKLAKQIYSLGVKHVFITRGEKGSTYYNGKQFYSHEIKGSAKVIDTLGAGDTFVSYVLTQLNTSDSPSILLKEASLKATKTCNKLGAFGYSI